MTYSPTVQGLINRFDPSTLEMPSWLTPFSSGPEGAYFDSPRYVLNSYGGAGYWGALETSNPLDMGTDFVICTDMVIGMGWAPVTLLYDSVSQPEGNYSIGAARHQAVVRYWDAQSGSNVAGYALYDAPWANQWQTPPTGDPDAYEQDEFHRHIIYINNLATDIGIDLYKINDDMSLTKRMPTSLPRVNNTTSYNNSPWFCITCGCPPNMDSFAYIYGIAVLKNRNVTVTDLDTGEVVKVYDSENNEIASATESNGTAIFDLSGYNWAGEGPLAYFKVFNEGGTYLRRMPNAAPDIVDIWGGSEFPGSNIIEPDVDTISPASWVNTINISVTITGDGFVTGAIVKLRLSGQTDIIATGIDEVSSTEIGCWFDLTGVAPGLWDVEVTNVDTGVGTLVEGFTVIGVTPTISNIAPSTGKRGDQITITGTSFGSDLDSVTFDGVPVNIASWSDTEIVVVAP